MGSKKARRAQNLNSTRSQLKRRKRLQHGANNKDAVKRVNIPGWDNKLTLQQNYKKLGVHLNPNDSVVPAQKAYELQDNQAVPSKMQGTLSDVLIDMENRPKAGPYQVKSMSVQEQYRLQDLIRKHGSNYNAMQRDLKLNINQDTAKQLEKRITLMKKLQSAGEDDDEEEEEQEEQEEESIEAMLDTLKNDKKYQALFEDLDSDEEQELLKSIVLDGEFMNDEDDEEEEVPVKVVAKKTKKTKESNIQIGDGGVKLVVPKLVKPKIRKPQVLTRE